MLVYGHRTSEVIVKREVATWQWNWFFISNTLEDVFRELKFCKAYKYKFFIRWI